MLGIGFEERSEAFDFGVSLQEVRRHNDSVSANEKAKKAGALSGLPNVEAKDYSLKEGETINITIGVRLPSHIPFLLCLLLTNYTEQRPPQSPFLSISQCRYRRLPSTFPPAPA